MTMYTNRLGIISRRKAIPRFPHGQKKRRNPPIQPRKWARLRSVMPMILIFMCPPPKRPHGTAKRRGIIIMITYINRSAVTSHQNQIPLFPVGQNKNQNPHIQPQKLGRPRRAIITIPPTLPSATAMIAPFMSPPRIKATGTAKRRAVILTARRISPAELCPSTGAEPVKLNYGQALPLQKAIRNLVLFGEVFNTIVIWIWYISIWESV